MNGRLHGKTAIVTGAAQGIGAAIAARFCAEGALVVGFDIDAPALEVTAVRLDGFEPVVVDLASEEAITTAIEAVRHAHPAIDILVNNAGVMSYGRIDKTDVGLWAAAIAINLEAAFHCCRLVAPAMIERGSGRIVNIASTEALQPEPCVSPYAAAKGGLIALTRAVAVDLAQFGIAVNAIAPGMIRTRMSIVDGVDETTTSVFHQWYVEQRKIPLARAGAPEEIAGAALFLASDDASYITGQVLVVDGGLTITF